MQLLTRLDDHSLYDYQGNQNLARIYGSLQNAVLPCAVDASLATTTDLPTVGRYLKVMVKQPIRLLSVADMHKYGCRNLMPSVVLLLGPYTRVFLLTVVVLH